MSTKAQVRATIESIGIVPVVRAPSPKLARAAVDALCKGGIPIAEITMTVPGAVELIAELVKDVGDSVLVGAGTVLDSENARRCLDAGAQFVVSPVFNVDLVQFVRAQNVLMCSGALTPTEVMGAWNAGSDIVKIFPAGEVGGAKYIRALRGPFPNIPFIPTGGVNLQTAAEFISAGAVALGVGGELVSGAGLKSGDFHQITNNARRFVSVVAEARAALHKTVEPAASSART